MEGSAAELFGSAADFFDRGAPGAGNSTQNTHALQTSSTQPWYPFPIPRRKEPDRMEISIQNVSMTYPNGKQALKDLNLDLRSPSLIGLLGPNGAGKSTLMKLLVAALLPTSGSILVDGQPPGQGGAAAESPAGLSAPGLRAVRRAHGHPVSGLHGGPEGAAGGESRHPACHSGRQPGGEGKGQDPYPVRRPAPAGGHRPGPAGGPRLSDL